MNHHASDARGIALLPLEVKTGPKIGDETAAGEAGTFEGYGAIFGNVDRDGDVVEPGAFAESLKARMPVLLWQHDTKAPIGRFEEVREDEKGLYVKGRLSMQGRGAEAYELLRMGALDGLSIGFITREATRDAATGTRRISKADLMEVSLVTFPANDLARTHSVKSAVGGASGPSLPDDPRAFERFLRDYGFSRTRARTITAKGFGADGFNHADSHEITALVQELKRRKLALEGKGRPPVGSYQLLAVVSRWSPWQTLGLQGATQDDYELVASCSLISNVETSFQIELEYTGKNGKTYAKGVGPGTVKAVIPGNGWQEPRIRVGANGSNGVMVRCIVTTRSV